MGGIRVIDRSGATVLHSTIWVDPEEVPVVFLVVKEGALALAHPDYVSETLHSVHNGDLDREDAWDHLLIKTPEMDFPVTCHVETVIEENKAVAYFRSGSKAGIVRLRAEI